MADVKVLHLRAYFIISLHYDYCYRYLTLEDVLSDRGERDRRRKRKRKRYRKGKEEKEGKIKSERKKREADE